MRISLGAVLLIIAILIIASVTFFVFTTTTSSPTTMNLLIPKESDKDNTDKYDSVKTKLTFILLKDDKIFSYYGNFIKGGKSVSNSEIDNLIEDGWKMFSKDSLVVVIKPTEVASYKATVDILDKMAIKSSDETYYEHYGNILIEMLACKIKKYSKINLLPVDIELIKKFNSATGR